MGIFQALGKWIDSLFSFLQQQTNTDVVQVLTHLVGITITLQIMFKLYQAMAGKSDNTIRELVYDLTIKVTVIGVALNLGGYLDLIKLSMEELHNLMSGDVNLYAQLDQKLAQTGELITLVWDKGNPFTGALGAILVAISFILGIIPSFIIVVTTGITLKILMLVAPIVIFVWIYPWFKNIFTQWLNIFVTNLLTVYIVGILLSKFSEAFGKFILQSKGNLPTTNVINIGLEALIMGLLLAGLVKVATSIAKELGTVSIETLTSKASNMSQTARDSINTARDGISGAKSLGAGASNVYNDTKGYVQSKISPTIPKIHKPR